MVAEDQPHRVGAAAVAVDRILRIDRRRQLLAALHVLGLVAPQRRGTRVLALVRGLGLDLLVARAAALGLLGAGEAREQHVALRLGQRPVLPPHGVVEAVGVFLRRLLVGGRLGGGARGLGRLAVAAARQRGGPQGRGQQCDARNAADAKVHAWAPGWTGMASRPSMASATSPGCSITVMWPLPSSSTLRACGILSA